MKILFKSLSVLLILASFTSCKSDVKGDKAEVSKKQEVKEVASEASFAVDAQTSQITWEGSKPTGKHNGYIKIKEGNVKLQKGEVVGGSFIIDMNSITCTDLEGDMKAGIEAHLKGQRKPGEEDDFFNVDKFPTAAFEITKVAKLANDEKATHLVYGNLSMKGKTNNLGFKANIKTDGDKVMVSTPNFVINRTQWGINYGSPSLFENLADKAINDNIGLSINLQAKG